ncbi:hypothetical protein BDZ89DRAFT_942624 [Hymenopellis radicata]|nr:hypothetical protein BDZ89DRAFT_942624 [Hymenopellis radicata]
MEGLRQAGTNFDQNEQPDSGINRGYFLPDPNSFIGGKEQDLLSMYLKIRDALTYRITSSRCEPLSTQHWRDLLGLGFVSTSRDDTLAAKRRSECKAKLVEYLKDSNLQGHIDPSNLHIAPIVWQGRPLTLPISDNIAQEILWELFEVNFRSELLALDHMAYKLKPEGFETAEGADFNELDASNTEDRRIRVLSYIPHFNGRLIPESLHVGRTGFASKHLEERRLALWALYRVMQTWTKAAAMTENMKTLSPRLSLRRQFRLRMCIWPNFALHFIIRLTM